MLANGATEIAWNESLLSEIHIQPSLPPYLYCDNLNATYLTANPIIHAWTKHIEIDFHFVRERLANNTLTIHFTPSEDQLADCVTKPPPIQRFLTLHTKLIVLMRPLNLRGDDKQCNMHRPKN